GSLARLAGKGKGLNRVANAALAGTPNRGIVVIDGSNRLRYASAFPAPELRALLARLRGDFKASAGPRGASTVRSFTMGGNTVTDVISSCPAGPKSPARTAGVLIAESSNVARNQWSNFLIWPALSGVAGLLLILLLGVLLARRVAQPVGTLATQALAISRGDGQNRIDDAGSRETQQLATAFNAMVDEGSRRRHLDHDLLANISHELAASLGLIQGHAEGLADGVIEGEEQRSAALQAITRESERLKRLTGNLLDLALLETEDVELQLENVPVAELLSNLATRFAPPARKQGVDLSVDAPPPVPEVRTDGFRLEQILVNLLSNALRYTPEGGTISMSVRPAAGGVTIAVADTGAWIPPEELSRIWERFYQVEKGRDRRRGSEGLGLGLAISQRIAGVLGGRIDVESVLGSGTTFRIWLPWNVVREG
ncbi:MAG: sensor histidine kinase, partial [Chloroflexota bacterium]